MMLPLLAAAAMLAPPSCREPVQKAEHRWVQALEAGDRAALAGLLDDGFTDFDWRGRVRGKAEVLAGVTGRRPGGIALYDLEARSSGQIGVVRGLTASRTPGGAETRAARFTDVFVCKDGRWRAIGAQETPVLEGSGP